MPPCRETWRTNEIGGLLASRCPVVMVADEYIDKCCTGVSYVTYPNTNNAALSTTSLPQT